jgi:enediyne core biosynthesis thioesterase
MKRYEYRHTVGFEDTNLVGNVYFANFIKWQGRCREFFLKDNCPEILDEITTNDLALITLNCSCEFIGELKAFDEVIIEMMLLETVKNRVKMLFEYYKVSDIQKTIVATGIHEIGCFRREHNTLQITAIPTGLVESLEAYKKN